MNLLRNIAMGKPSGRQRAGVSDFAEVPALRRYTQQNYQILKSQGAPPFCHKSPIIHRSQPEPPAAA